MVRSSTLKKLFITTTMLASIALTGCETTTSGSSTSVDLSDLNDQLNDIVSNNSCTASFQCKVLEVGERACGGPSRYVVYSTLNTAQEKAEQLAEQITAVERSSGQALTVNDCSPVLPVQSLCISQQCQAIEIK
ncbi:hypothetical protein [Pseudoalteromonas apostichopi]|jgi:hypothetical protein|uniref:hypothetical protein n=1 Tax=Pseudoalteromonas apostichopi TaxID=3035452 RepID=UPI0025737CE7|nr:hypothetical protein [Pseudoalteromonas sp. FE4]